MKIPGLGSIFKSEEVAHRSDHTRVLATFYSDDEFSGAVGVEKEGPFRIISTQYSHGFGSPMATWSLTIHPEDHHESLVRLWSDPEDVWVLVEVLNGEDKTTLQLGLVESIRETTARDKRGTGVITSRMECSSFGKAFNVSSLMINFYDSNSPIPLPIMNPGEAAKIGGSPNEIVAGLLKAWMGTANRGDKQWRLPGGLAGGPYLYDKLKRKLDDLPGQLFDPSLYSPSAKPMGLWSTLQKYQNGVMNEMWLDLDPTADNAPTIFLRERPFPVWNNTRSGVDRSRWNAVTTHDLPTSVVQTRDIVKGSAQSRFNYWQLNCSGVSGSDMADLVFLNEAAKHFPGKKGFPGSYPVYDIASIQKHGFRAWQQSTDYVPVRSDIDMKDGYSSFGSIKSNAIPSVWLQRIHDWYVVNPRQLSGTLTLSPAQPQIRIGDRVREQRTHEAPITYYVESVSLGHSYPGAGTSTITVTRGEYEDEDHLADHYAALARGPLKSVDFYLRDDVTDIEENAPADVPDAIQNVDPAASQEQRVAAGSGDQQAEKDRTTIEQQSAGDLPGASASDPAEDTQSPENVKLTRTQLERGDPIPESDQTATVPQDNVELGESEARKRPHKPKGG